MAVIIDKGLEARRVLDTSSGAILIGLGILGVVVSTRSVFCARRRLDLPPT